MATRRRKRSRREEEKEHENIVSKLPLEIFVNIFSRLPLKTIINCTEVCKAWKHVIFGQPYFAKAHLGRSSHIPMLFIIGKLESWYKFWRCVLG